MPAPCLPTISLPDKAAWSLRAAIFLSKFLECFPEELIRRDPAATPAPAKPNPSPPPRSPRAAPHRARAIPQPRRVFLFPSLHLSVRTLRCTLCEFPRPAPPALPLRADKDSARP